MLSKNDKKWVEETIEKVVQKELKDWIESFLKYEVTAEKGSQSPGEVPGRIEKTNIFVFDALMMYLPRIAAAMRGSQADAVVAKNRAIEAGQKVDALGQTLLGMEKNFKAVTQFAVYLKKTGLLEQLESAVAMIEHTRAIEAPTTEETKQ